MERNLLLVTIAVAILAASPTIIDKNKVHADLLAKDDVPDIAIDGNVTTLGQIDVAISPYDGYLPQNGTLTISTLGANDLDINAMPPAGMTIVIDNQSATITSNPVRVDMPAAASAPAPAPAPAADSGGDEDEE
jgi:hypothetical protein